MGQTYLVSIAFVSSDAAIELTTFFNPRSGREVRVVHTENIFNPATAAITVREKEPQVIIIDTEVAGYDITRFLSLREQTPRPVVLVALGATEMMAKLLQSGVDLVFPTPLNEHTMTQMERLLPDKYKKNVRKGGVTPDIQDDPAPIEPSPTPSQPADEEGTCLAVWSPKGGVGKTFLSVEVAMTMALGIGGEPGVEPPRIAVVDANMNGGAVDLRLNLPSGGYNILSAATDFANMSTDFSEIESGDSDITTALDNRMMGYLQPVTCQNGESVSLKVLRGPVHMGQARHQNIGGRQGMAFMGMLIQLLKRHFDFVIIDLGSSTNAGVHLAALAAADRVLTVTDADRVTTTKIATELRENVIPTIRKPLDRFDLVINRWFPECGLTTRQLTEHTTMNLVGVIPDDSTDQVLIAANQGVSFVDRWAREKSPPEAVRQTLEGVIALAAAYYNPVAEGWETERKTKRTGRLAGLLGMA